MLVDKYNDSDFKSERVTIYLCLERERERGREKEKEKKRMTRS